MSGLLTLPNLLAWSVQAALVVAAALLTIRLVRLDEPDAKYVLLRVVLLLSLALPAAAPLADLGSGPPRQASVRAEVSGLALAAGGPAGAARLGLSWTGASAATLLLVLLAGTCARLGWIALGVLRLQTLRRAGEAAAPDAMHDELQATIGTRAAIRYVRGLGQPVTFGVRSPVVLLPQSLQGQHPAIARAVLAHELWHVRRRDWTWTVLEEGIRALFWFHPAIWLLLSRIQAVREEVVDQLTILATGSRRSYMHALLAYANERPLFTATAFAQRRHLVHRLVLISKEAVMSGRRVVGSCAVVALVVLVTGWHAVQAFPLTQEPAGWDLLSQVAGPLERRAKPITPENPVPRRTHFVVPDYPLEAAEVDARGTVIAQVTLDEAGHLAEARVAGLTLMLGGSQATINVGVDGQFARQALRRTIGRLPEAQQPGAERAVAAMLQAAVRSVRQWQYDTPVDGPISFPVTINITPDVEASGAPAPQSVSGPGIRPEWDGALRVGGNIKPPMKIRHVNPVYPQEARDAGVAGIVIIEARIGADGHVEDARVLRSIPMLDQAALDAVQQWEFVPTLLNGQPVPVIMTVTVNFTLQ